MFDNQLIALIIQALIAGEATAGIPGTPIKQAFQPTQQGVNTQPTCYLHKVMDHLLGTPKKSNVWDKTSSTMVKQQIQIYETTFQFSALYTQDPNTPTQLTASDLLNLIASILQSSTTIDMLIAQDVGVQKIGVVNNPYFDDDRAREEAFPNLDIIFSHKQIITSTAPIFQSIEANILTV